MHILFISLSDFSNIEEHGLYTDLLREFAKHGHMLTVISPIENGTNQEAIVLKMDNCTIIKPSIGKIQKTNYIRKGLSLLGLGNQITRALDAVSFARKPDLLLYATPPITIAGVVKKLKRKFRAHTVLMLKDIWPQEIVDLHIISQATPVFYLLRQKEKQLYAISDCIGCDSPANIRYILKHNTECHKDKLIRINNSVDPRDPFISEEERKGIFEKYGIPEGRIVFFYGGNLGKPQDISFLIKCLRTQRAYTDRFFVVCGQGTEYGKLKEYVAREKQDNVLLLGYIQKSEYDCLVKGADVGLIFLNHLFTVPNWPSRYSTYLEYAKPVIACTDSATDIGEEIETKRIGWWCESNDERKFAERIEEACALGRGRLVEMGKRARTVLEENYTVKRDYERIVKYANEHWGI